MLWLVAVLIAITLGISGVAVAKLRAVKRAVGRCGGWKPVRGEVVTASIREKYLSHVGRQYIPMVEYRYVFGGTTYVGNNLTVGVDVQYSRRRNAERRLAGYSSGQRVQVRVDPSSPVNSVLECRAPIIPVLWTTLIGAWVLLIAGLGLLLLPGLDGPEPILRLGIGL